MTTLSSVQSFGSVAHWPEGAVYIGMPCNAARAYGIRDQDVGPFGKPWHLKDDPRGWAAAYAEYLAKRLKADADFALAVKQLNGKLLLCYCTAKAERRGTEVACHGRILIEYVEMLNA